MLPPHSGHLLFNSMGGILGYFLFQPYSEYTFRLYWLHNGQLFLVEINKVSVFHSLHLGANRCMDAFSIVRSEVDGGLLSSLSSIPIFISSFCILRNFSNVF